MERKNISDGLKDNINEILKDLRELKRKQDIVKKNADKEMRKSVSQVGEYGKADRVKFNMKPYKKESIKLQKLIDRKERELSKSQNKLYKIENQEKRIHLDIYKENESNEERNKTMSIMNKYTNEDIDDAKMAIYEACRLGKISTDQKTDLMERLDDAVMEYNHILENATNVEDLSDYDDDDEEVMDESAEDDTMTLEDAKLIIYESWRNGDISEEERDEILEGIMD